MAQKPLKIFINTSATDQGDSLVTSFTNPAPPPAFSFSLVDTARQVEIHNLAVNPQDPDSTGAQPFIYVSPPDSNELSVGQFDLPVQGGTFALLESAGAQTANAIPYNESVSAMQIALRAAWTTNFSTCTVSGSTGGPWIINRGVNGTYGGTISGDTAGITPPQSQVEIVVLQTGTSLRPAIIEITLLQPPAILGTLSTALPSAFVTPADVTTGDATHNAVQNIKWNTDAVGGAVSILGTFPVGNGLASQSIANPTVLTTNKPHGLTIGDMLPLLISGTSTTPTTNGNFTGTVTGASTITIPVNVTVGGTGGLISVIASVGPIPYNATETQFTSVLWQHPATNANQDCYGVVQNGPGDYNITFLTVMGLQAVTTIGATQSLVVPVGLSGTLNCRTAGVLALLGASSNVTTNLQITQTISGVESDVVSADNAILRNDLSPPGAVGSNPLSPTLTAIPVGNTLFVDSTFGSSDGIRARMDKPFDTITDAVAAASVGDLIWVWPGTYTDSSVQFAGEIHLCEGAAWNSTSDTISIDTAIEMSVTGRGTFHPGGSLLLLNNASAYATVKGKSFIVGGHSFYLKAGNIRCVDFDLGDGTTSNNAIMYWQNDDAPAARIGDVDDFTIRHIIAGSGDYGFAQISGGDGTENLHINFNRLNNTGGSPALIACQTNSDTRVWITGQFLAGQATGGGSSIAVSGGKIYCEFEKVIGPIVNGDELHLETQKFNGTLTVNAGLFECEIGEFDDTGLTGLSLIAISGGVSSVSPGQAIRGSDGAAIIITGGTLEVNGGRFQTDSSQTETIDCTAGSGTLILNGTIVTNSNANCVPLQVSSGCTVILHGAILVAGASASGSILAGTGTPTVNAMGAWANKAVGAGITIAPAGGLTVDAAVI